MNKRKRGRKFGRKRDQRKAFMRDLAEALVKHGKIETTEARAKELRPFIEKWITKSRKNTLHSRRMLGKIFSDTTGTKLINEIAPKFKDRPGGYTRIIKKAPRKGDAARRAVIEFVE
ncbi:MAG: 50S ribosomal protein L17 [Candidatus Spechtbacteria bacterium RIFCSPLOWO2_02_FULL_38_8]|uniref:Large ribosomal subunit protein bL17 n=1 Tax=Candidatus Spechtbacteria bacterium RIFCSPLOWO2_02_FULL_38_8 TaxID=1802164 RepID=A0A1G2HG30_9BACT|nr:MAG: 50S ribosomal protein L17 [Candidatus Spechtbacteria bacterium RIFCSPLOWO2_02_FULL_38_8]